MCEKVICLLQAHPRPSQANLEQCHLLPGGGANQGEVGQGRARGGPRMERERPAF